MADDTKKRRLRILNEVLPAPTVGAAESAPRQRALSHMHKLLALATAGATLGSGCPEKSQGGGTATAPPPETAATAPSTAATAIATAEPTSKPTAGYLVVDMMPEPASATARFIAPPPSGSAKAKIPEPPRGYRVVDPIPHPPRRGNNDF